MPNLSEKKLDEKIRKIVEEYRFASSVTECVEWIRILRKLSVMQQKIGDHDQAYNLSVLALKFHRELTKSLKTKMDHIELITASMNMIAEVTDDSTSYPSISPSLLKIDWKHIFRDS